MTAKTPLTPSPHTPLTDRQITERYGLHTPGPFMSQYGAIYETAGMTKVAEIVPRNVGDWAPEDHANAVLFAEAPNLLEALEELLEQADDMLFVCQIEGQDRPAYYEAMREANITIARALGKEA